MRRTRMMLAALLLAATVTTAGPAGAEPAVMDPPPTRRAECFDTTANVLLDRLPGDHPRALSCLPRSQLSGPVGRSARAVLASVPVVPAVCSPSDCAIYIWGKHGIGYQDLWTYPVRTVDFYGYRCYEELNRAPQGKPGSDAFGLFDSYGQGAMTHKPTIWLQWCTQNGLVRSGAMVACNGTPVYPYYFNNSSCTWSITPGFKPTRTVGAGWTFTGVAGEETVGLMATIVAGTNGGRDVLIQGWRWSL